MANNDNLKPFPAGQSGNPNGRPKGSRNRATVLRELLEVKIKLNMPDGSVLDGTLEEAMALGLIQKAMKGSPQAFREAMDSVYGKNVERIDHTTGGKPLATAADVRNLSPEQKRQLLEMKRAAQQDTSGEEAGGDGE